MINKEKFSREEMEAKLAKTILGKAGFISFCFEIFPLNNGLLDIFYVISAGLLWCDGDSEERALALFNVLQPPSAFTDDLEFNQKDWDTFFPKLVYVSTVFSTNHRQKIDFDNQITQKIIPVI